MIGLADSTCDLDGEFNGDVMTVKGTALAYKNPASGYPVPFPVFSTCASNVQKYANPPPQPPYALFENAGVVCANGSRLNALNTKAAPFGITGIFNNPEECAGEPVCVCEVVVVWETG